MDAETVGAVISTIVGQTFNQIPPWLLLASGALLGWLRNFWDRLYRSTIGQLVQRITVSVTVEEMDHAQAWVWLQYWAEKRLRERRISSLMLRKATVDQNISDDKIIEQSVGRDVGYELAPAYGIYPFVWRNRYFLIFDSGKDDQPTAGGQSESKFFGPRRKVTITVWGTRDRNLLLEILSESRLEWEAGHPASLRYFFHRYSYWNPRPMAARKRNTVYFPDGLIEDVLNDAQQFLKSKDRYEPMGIPWRRGYLLYGPPGTGKTTLVQMMATELNLPLYYLSLAALRSREDLASLLDDVRPGSIVLIEDVDCIAAAAERMSAKKDEDSESSSSQAKITPSDLLNYIDGIIASQGRLLIMTTNYPEKLDRALVRTGRVDRKWEITYANKTQLLQFHAAACACEMTQMPADRFLSLLPSSATIADAQALLFRGSFVEIDENA